MTTKTLPRVRESSLGTVDLSKEQGWLSQHQHEYIEQWVVLDGDRLVGFGKDPRPIFAQAKAEGVRMPFMLFIRDQSEPFCGAWG